MPSLKATASKYRLRSSEIVGAVVVPPEAVKGLMVGDEDDDSAEL
jgi:hypothetical protein